MQARKICVRLDQQHKINEIREDSDCGRFVEASVCSNLLSRSLGGEPDCASGEVGASVGVCGRSRFLSETY
jgi:hypothetical protein